MYKLIVVGAGSLGEDFCIEAARRAFAQQMPLQITLIDFDTIEERNLASQGFLPSEVGTLKAESVINRISQFPLITAKAVTEKVTEENWESLLEVDENTTIVDVVDNYPTRVLLWTAGQALNVPVLHAGMATDGNGQVSWNYKEMDSFSLSPKNTSPDMQAKLKEAPDVKLPPCQLNAFRQLIRNTAMAAVTAYFISIGCDNTKTFMSDGENVAERGLFSTWKTSINSMNYWKEMTFYIDPNGAPSE